jgi:hypothetical protein
MLMAGGMAYAAGRRGGPAEADYQEEQPQYEQVPQQQVPPAPPAPAAAASDDPIDELQRLGDLHSSGVLTDDEFAAAKAKVLGS